MNDAGSHMRKLQELSNKEVRFIPVTEYHRYYWLDEKQMPEVLRGPDNIKDSRMKSDYEYACESTLQYWEENKSGAYDEDRRFVKKCVSFQKQDTLAKILVDLKIPAKSEYASACEFDADKQHLTRHCDPQYHIKPNPITSFSEQYNSQKIIMRK